MSVATVFTRAQLGLEAPRVTVETHITNGLPAFNIVGLAHTAVKESKDRVRSALLNCDFDFPLQRITVNLAPADIPKFSGRYDLAIALSILLASEQLKAKSLEYTEFYGELALNGDLRFVNGLVPAIIQGYQQQYTAFVPAASSAEAGLLGDAEVFTAMNLLELCAHLKGERTLPTASAGKIRAASIAGDFRDVKGQRAAKRALEIAAAGRHNLLLSGSPGTGKTMLASRMPGILPPLDTEQALDVAAIHSCALQSGGPPAFPLPPFRAPHHSCSAVALLGGGRQVRAGEISLAHHGVLFLDELPEFPRTIIEALREPLESGSINIARAEYRASYPADFLLLAARNPCPCGYLYEPGSKCRCTPDQVERYQRKLSGPMLDRIDIHVRLRRQDTHKLLQEDKQEEASSAILARVLQARQHQQQRAGKLNSTLNAKELRRDCALDKSALQRMRQASEQLQLSMRAYQRVLRVARTIADLRGGEAVSSEDLMEALAYREN